ncbi:hypothetical protein HYFRA_00000738 [Hymenoscyphus fraxineus]|uniref:L-ornithine N(5)-monooxygenase [NAD(P)H] n=1 Tax=Hymenoscyphus fraxineus TaxID=746836 RepID=A0A9N9KUZ3_9HELO|nr:hypothetical protein HYFRA_00000738 [Hymenoscyphus fraxineus]
MDMPTTIVPPAGGKRRAPKARTMTAKDWKKYEDRLKQLYADEGKSYKELVVIMNHETGRCLTERQLKAKVQKMKLERNSKPGDRRAVVRHIQHRMIINKNCGHVRMRGHEISAEKLSRWINEFAPQFSFMPARSPSPLPSCISIYTSSQLGSPELANTRLLAGTLPTTGMTKANDESSAVIERLLKYARTPTNEIRKFEARSVFNDLQTILHDDYITREICRYSQIYLNSWNPRVEDDLMRVRNMMNMNQGVIKIDTTRTIPSTSSSMAYSNFKTSRRYHRYAAWKTPYGRVETSFWTNLDNPNTESAKNPYPKDFSAARIVVLPSQARSRVVVDFTPGLDPWAKITYQATIPKSSRVFQIIESGNLHQLMEVIQEGTASLTDRDENGCSLFNYAIFYSHPDLCQFLVDKGADVNAVECDINLVDPVHSLSGISRSVTDEETRARAVQCTNICYTNFADPSIETYVGSGEWIDCLNMYIIDGSLEDLRHILNYGGVFLDLKKSKYIHMIANICGYVYSEALSIVDKAITLIKRGIDISSCDSDGSTVLHVILRCKRFHEEATKKEAWRKGHLWSWRVSLKAPKDLLIACISAGADVYAKNNDGKTPTTIAQMYGRVKEWSEALTECGFYAPGVLAYSDPQSSSEELLYERRTSKLSFDEYCRKREREPRIKEGWDPSYNDELWKRGDGTGDEGSGDESSEDFTCPTSNEEPTTENAMVHSSNHEDAAPNVSTEEMEQDYALSGFGSTEDMSSETFMTGIDFGTESFGDGMDFAFSGFQKADDISIETFMTGIDFGTGSFSDGMDFGYDELAASQLDFSGDSFDLDACLNDMIWEGEPTYENGLKITELLLRIARPRDIFCYYDILGQKNISHELIYSNNRILRPLFYLGSDKILTAWRRPTSPLSVATQHPLNTITSTGPSTFPSVEEIFRRCPRCRRGAASNSNISLPAIFHHTVTHNIITRRRTLIGITTDFNLEQPWSPRELSETASTLALPVGQMPISSMVPSSQDAEMDSPMRVEVRSELLTSESKSFTDKLPAASFQNLTIRPAQHTTSDCFPKTEKMEQISSTPPAAPAPVKKFHSPSSQVLDLVCVGFGTNSLALATAIKDNNSSSNVLFLEQKPDFSAKSDSSSRHMDVSFMHDLATLRDPTSEFTFLSYLQQQGRMNEFVEALSESSSGPLRGDFEEYLGWAAAKCSGLVAYGQQVISVESLSSSRWAVQAMCMETGETRVLIAKNVVFGNEEKARVAEHFTEDSVTEQNESMAMLQVMEAAKQVYRTNPQASSDSRFSTLCIRTVAIHNLTMISELNLSIAWSMGDLGKLAFV